MGKYVYVIRKGQYMITKDQYEFYGSEIFSSHKKAREYIDWVINVNKGYCREKDYHYNCAIPEDLRLGREKLLNYQVDYKWRGEGDHGQVECKARIHVEQIELQ